MGINEENDPNKKFLDQVKKIIRDSGPPPPKNVTDRAKNLFRSWRAGQKALKNAQEEMEQAKKGRKQN